MSNVDVPQELKRFWKAFDNASSRWDYATVFDDFLTMCLPNFSFSQTLASERDKVLSKYNSKELDFLRECFTEMILAINDQIQITEWYDFFGDLYQSISSRYKSSKFGQFFTPSPVVDLIVKMTNPGSENRDEVLLNDCACGSSRMLIASDVHSKIHNKKKLYLIGQDLDPICCKMSVLNFVFHGCEGEVLCMDTLTMDFRFGYKIKTIYPCPIPQIIMIDLRDSRIFKKAGEEVKTITSEHLFDLDEYTQPITFKKLDYAIKTNTVKNITIQEELFKD